MIDPQALDETARLAGNHRDRLASLMVIIAERSAVEALPEQVVVRVRLNPSYAARAIARKIEALLGY